MPFSREIHIGNAVIREGGPCFVIAEAGINHNGDIDLAKKLIDMSKAAGADAVKFQTFKAEEEVTAKLQKVDYQKTSAADEEPYFEMIQKLEFSDAQWQELVDYCAEKEIVFLSTPSEEVSAQLLNDLAVPAFKIGSNDLVTIPFLEKIAAWKKPTILSTGMATMDEIQEALDVFTRASNVDVVVLQCTSSYPTPPQELNLRVITTLRETFGCLVGFSDHSAATAAAPLAVLLGSTVVETHITLDKNLPGPDQKMALEPHMFASVVEAIRTIDRLDEQARQAAIRRIPDAAILLGNPEKRPTPAEIAMRTLTRKGIVARRAIKKGEVLQASMLAYKRPLEGIPPRRYKELLGKRARVDMPQDSYIIKENLA
ncbi:MAG TPA: N-acetylneuraminate synthase family protein [Candidatus Paceibacterota bacterium]|nr:N-acetylneuraminate synthase family protein [Candidatus Paceibacterota bacterium]